MWNPNAGAADAVDDSEREGVGAIGSVLGRRGETALGWLVVRRLLSTVPLLLGVMLVTFALVRGAGGSPFTPPPGYVQAGAAHQRTLERFYRLDEPWPVEFGVYVKHVVTFDFGPSLVLRDLDVDALIRESVPVTLKLVLIAAAWAFPAGVFLGLWAAARRDSLVDLIATSTASAFLVVPVFFVAFVLHKYLVVEWAIAPPGFTSWRARILPALALGLGLAGYVGRLVRTAVLETLAEDYVRTARAKGLREQRLLYVHVLRNSLAPVLSAAIPMVALLLTGAFFVENAFRIPGVSFYFVEAARLRDYPVILNLTVVLAAVVVTANAIADILLALIDPRIRERVRA